MRKLIINLIAFLALVQWLGTVDILVLLTAVGAAIAGITCLGLLLTPEADDNFDSA